MGNRASIVFTDGKQYSPSIYLHWNGGPESVYAFIEEFKRRLPGGGHGIDYGAARLTQLIGEFFDHGERFDKFNLGISSQIPEDVERNPFDADNGLYLFHWNEGDFVVRRFKSGKWSTSKQVTAERESAEKHEYHRTFAEFFKGFAHGRVPNPIDA